ncbi:hypothetical protein ES708_34726 [subsurface metagenome]
MLNQVIGRRDPNDVYDIEFCGMPCLSIIEKADTQVIISAGVNVGGNADIYASFTVGKIR